MTMFRQTDQATDNSAPPRSLGHSTATGFAWLAAQTLGARAATFGAQIALAWLLVREDFGVVALAQTVAAFTNLIQNAGLREILIQRARRIEVWETHAWWLAMSCGLAATLLLCAAAPLAAIAYDEPRLVGVVLVLALSAVPNALAHIPQAKLRAQLRFKAVAGIELLRTLGIALLSVLLAAYGLGPYALIIPIPIVALAVLVVSFRLARPRIRFRLNPRRWGYLLRSGSMMVAGNACLVLVAQGDYMMLGLFHDAAIVGVYFFAFNLARQAMQMFTTNIVGVLLPALSNLKDDPVRITDAYLRAARALAIIGIPIGLSQAASARAVVEHVFAKHWADAIPLIQLLSVGMAIRLVTSTCGSLIIAQGRWATKLTINATNAVTFLIAAGIPAWLGGPREVAWSVMIYMLVFGPTQMYIAIRPGGRGVRDLFRVFAPPISAAVLGAAAAASALHLAGPFEPGSWAELALMLGVGVPVYAACAWALARETVTDLVRRGIAMVPGGHRWRRVRPSRGDAS